MSQTIAFPERCLACKADRLGISEGTAHYKCGTTVKLRDERVRVVRTVQCIRESGKVVA